MYYINNVTYNEKYYFKQDLLNTIGSACTQSFSSKTYVMQKYPNIVPTIVFRKICLCTIINI